jgi:hypothetical protein
MVTPLSRASHMYKIVRMPAPITCLLTTFAEHQDFRAGY